MTERMKKRKDLIKWNIPIYEVKGLKKHEYVDNLDNEILCYTLKCINVDKWIEMNLMHKVSIKMH